MNLMLTFLFELGQIITKFLVGNEDVAISFPNVTTEYLSYWIFEIFGFCEHRIQQKTFPLIPISPRTLSVLTNLGL